MSDPIFLKSPYQSLIDGAGLPPEAVRTVKPVEPDDEEATVSAPAPEPEAQASAQAYKPSKDLTPPPELRPLFEGVAAHYKVPVNVLMAIAHQESRYNPNAKNAETGASGMAQYLDSTAKSLGINPTDPNEAIPAAAMQLRERLDKGMSIEDAIKEHFAGPNRKLWGPKTAAYGDEVMGKARAIGEKLYGDAADAAPSPAPAPSGKMVDLGEADPGLNLANAPNLNPEHQVEEVPKTPGATRQNGFSPSTMGRNEYQRNFLALNPRATPAALDSAMAQYDQQADAVKQIAMDKAINGPKGVPSADEFFQQRLDKKLAAKQAANNPRAGGIVTQLPEMPTNAPPTEQEVPAAPTGMLDRGLDNVLGAASSGLHGAIGSIARRLGDTEEAAKQDKILHEVERYRQAAGYNDTVSGKVGGIVGGVLPLMAAPEGVVANLAATSTLFGLPAYDAAYKRKIDEGYTDAQAKLFAYKDFVMNVAGPILMNKGAGKIFGQATGDVLSKADMAKSVGQATAEGAAFSAANTSIDKVMNNATGHPNDAAWIDPKDMLASGVAFAGMNAGHLGSAKLNEANNDPAHIAEQFGRALQDDAARVHFGADSARQVAAERMSAASQNPATITPQDTARQPGDVGPAPTTRTVPMPPEQAAPPVPADIPAQAGTRIEPTLDTPADAPSAPLESAVAQAVPGRQSTADKLRAIRGENDGVPAVPAPPAGPLTDALHGAAAAHAADPAPAPVMPRPEPEPPALDTLPMEDLQARLKAVAAQQKAADPAGRKALQVQRKEIEKAINSKAADAKAASKPAEEPLTTGPFEDMGQANKMMARHAEATGVPHEVVPGADGFRVQRIEGEGHAVDSGSAGGGTDRRGRSGGPAAGDGAPDGQGTGRAGSASGARGRGNLAADGVPDAAGDRVRATDPANAAAAVGVAHVPEPAKVPEEAPAEKSTEGEKPAAAVDDQAGAAGKAADQAGAQPRVSGKGPSPKEARKAGITLTEARAHHKKQEDAIRQAAENIARRKAEKEAAAQAEAAAPQPAEEKTQDQDLGDRKGLIRERLRDGKKLSISTAGDGSASVSAGVRAGDPIPIELTKEERKALKLARADYELADTHEEREAARTAEQVAIRPAVDRMLGEQAAPQPAAAEAPAPTKHREPSSIEREMKNPTSWVLRNKTTGEVQMETSNPSVVAKLNTAKYEAVPVLQHLQEINTPGTIAHAAARGEPLPKPAKTSTAGERMRAKVKAENPFMAFLSEHGIHVDERSDTGAEKARHVMVPGYGNLYRKAGLRIDELANLAHEAGFLSDRDMADPADNGGTRRLADMIERAAHRKEVIGRATEADPAGPSADALLMAEAEKLGIDIKGKSADEVYDAVTAAHADDFSNNEARLAIEAMQDADIPLDGGKSFDNLTDEDIDAIFGIKTEAAGARETGGQDQGDSAGATPGRDAEAGAAREGDDAEFLKHYTPAEIRAREEAQEAIAKAAEKEARERDAAKKKERDDKDIAARMDSTVDNFQLGQTADDALAGQKGLLDDAPRFSTATDDRTPSDEMRESVITQWGKVVEPVSGYKYLSAKVKKTNRGIFIVDGKFDRPAFKEVMTEAIAAGLDTKKLQVVAESASYTGASIDLLKISDFAEGSIKGRREDQDDVRYSVADDRKTVQVDGQRRPIENSNGVPIAEDMHKQVAFWRFFGDSAIVDEHGRPRVIFHGTNADFDQFSLDKTGTSWDAGKLGQGFYFSTDPRLSSSYASNARAKNRDDAPNVMPVYASIKNPLNIRVDFRAGENLWDKLRDFSEQAGIKVDPVADPDSNQPNPEWSKPFRDALEAAGHDGVVLHFSDGHQEIVAFHPEQIKSATGNSGKFDPENPDIRYSSDHPMAAESAREVEPVLQSLADKGAIVLHDDASTLPVNGKAPAGVQALTTADGTIHVVASALRGDAMGVVLHEAFHAGAKPLLGTKVWGDLEQRLGSLYRQGEQSTGRARAFFDAARERVESAKARGAVKPGMEAEEFGAYAIEEYANAPTTVKKWVDDVIGNVKAWALKRFGKQLGDVTPAQLSSIAKMALLDKVKGSEAPAPSADLAAEPAFAVSKPGAPATPTVPTTAREKLAEFIHQPVAELRSVAHDIAVRVVPMATGSDAGKAVAKDFANQTRQAQAQWHAFDKVLREDFTKDQLEAMWQAADEENDLRRDGKTSKTKGLAGLPKEQREVVDLLHSYGEQLWDRAKKVGLVDANSDGVHYWTPRVAANIFADGSVERITTPGGEFSKDATNLKTSASSTKQRKHDTTADSEAALQAKHGADAAYVKNIRVMPLAMAQLEAAIAGRSLVNQVKAQGQIAGVDLISDRKLGKNYDTFDHPALKQWMPKTDWQDVSLADLAAKGHTIQGGQVVRANGTPLKSYRVDAAGNVQKLGPMLDSDGKPVMVASPLYVHKDFVGPLRAVLKTQSPLWYQRAMQLKGGVTSMIMVSPLTHNLVIWGKAMPTMAATMGWKNNAKNIATLGVNAYVVGYKARQNHAMMKELIGAGLVPVSGRGMSEDVAGIAQGIEPGRSWTAQALGKVADLAGKDKGDAVRRGVDKAGEFWHETLLWNRVADMQAGMAVMLRATLMDKGFDQDTANRFAAHFANRYAGMVPQEAMSQGAHMLANLALFSKSFNLTNVGAYKDVVKGLPGDVQAQIRRNVADAQRAAGKSDEEADATARKVLAMAQKTARIKGGMILALDIGAMTFATSLVQALWQGQDADKIAADFKKRAAALGQHFKESPLDVIRHPLDALASLSQTADNAPGKEDRVRIGEDKVRGDSYYARLPVGKMGEELKNYMDFIPGMRMGHNKMSTFVKPFADLFGGNEDFQGESIVKEHAGALVQAAQFGAYWIKSQLPSEDIAALARVANGTADNMDKAKLLGTLTGVTVGRVAGGDAVAEIRAQSRDLQAKLRDALPDAREAVRRGNGEEAMKLLIEAGQTPQAAQRLIVGMQNPSMISRGKLKHFLQTAKPEEAQKVINMMQRK